MKIKVITPPAVEPLTRAEAKQHMGISYTHNDTLVDSAIRQAREYCEGYQRRKFVTQTLELYLDRFPPCGRIEFLDCSPVQSITSIKYIDKNGAEHTLDESDYIFDNVSFVSEIKPADGKTWPTDELKSTNSVIIRFVAGYPTVTEGEGEEEVTIAQVPESVKWAMNFHIKSIYDINTPEERKDYERVRDACLRGNKVPLC
jgi:uncharacterized phiE125 gp8 family phage protein